jgi:hypothetical protein
MGFGGAVCSLPFVWTPVQRAPFEKYLLYYNLEGRPMQWVAIAYAISIGWAISYFNIAKHDRLHQRMVRNFTGAGTRMLREERIDRIQLLIVWSPLFLWPVWAFVSLIWAILFDGNLLSFGNEVMILLFSIIYGGVAFCWNTVNYLLPGVMVGIGVYRFALNDYALTPFHYFFDLNSWLTSGLFAERPMPSFIIIQIHIIVGLGLLSMVTSSISSKN